MMKKNAWSTATKRLLLVVILLTVSLQPVSAFAEKATGSSFSKIGEQPGYRREVYTKLCFSDGSLIHAPEKAMVELVVKPHDGYLGPIKIRARFRASISVYTGEELLEERSIETIYDDRDLETYTEIGTSRLRFCFVIDPEEMKVPMDTVHITGSFLLEELDDNNKVIARGEADCLEELTFGTPTACFEDIVKDSWYQNGVSFATGYGLFRGVTEKRFAPNETITRGMLVTVLWRWSGMPTVEQKASFTDVPEKAYYAKAVDWAAANSIIMGYSEETFAPNDPITREQLAVILHRFNRYYSFWNSSAKLDFSEYSENSNDMIRYTSRALNTEDKQEPRFYMGFEDEDQISDYAYESVTWAVLKGMMQGTSLHRFEPKAFATRAQVAVVLQRLFVKRVLYNYEFSLCFLAE